MQRLTSLVIKKFLMDDSFGRFYTLAETLTESHKKILIEIV